MIFYLIYILVSLILAYVSSLFVNKRLSKVLIFSLIMGLFGTLWFKNPGDSHLAPVLSIFLLESTIVDDNGITRLLRPFGLVVFFVGVFSFALWKKTKN